jgi:hypothetical protein
VVLQLVAEKSAFKVQVGFIFKLVMLLNKEVSS